MPQPAGLGEGWATGLTISSSGLLKTMKQRLGAMIAAAGGRFVAGYGHKCTHLVVKEAVTLQNMSKKLCVALDQYHTWHPSIVSTSWVEACDFTGKRLKESPYMPVSLLGKVESCKKMEGRCKVQMARRPLLPLQLDQAGRTTPEKDSTTPRKRMHSSAFCKLMPQPAKARIYQLRQHDQQQPAKSSTADGASSNLQAGPSGVVAVSEQRAGNSAASHSNARGAGQQADRIVEAQKRAGCTGSGQRKWQIGGQGSRARSQRVREGKDSEDVKGLVDSMLLMAQGPKRQRSAEADSNHGASAPAAKRPRVDLCLPALAYSPAEAGSMDAADGSVPARALTELPVEAPGSAEGDVLMEALGVTSHDPLEGEPTLLRTPRRDVGNNEGQNMKKRAHVRSEEAMVHELRVTHYGPATRRRSLWPSRGRKPLGRSRLSRTTLGEALLKARLVIAKQPRQRAACSPISMAERQRQWSQQRVNSKPRTCISMEAEEEQAIERAFENITSGNAPDASTSSASDLWDGGYTGCAGHFSEPNQAAADCTGCRENAGTPTPVFAGIVAALDPDLPHDESRKSEEMLMQGGGRVAAGGVYLGGGATHIICQPDSASRWLAMGVSIISPQWVEHSLMSREQQRCAQLSMDILSHLPLQPQEPASAIFQDTSERIAAAYSQQAPSDGGIGAAGQSTAVPSRVCPRSLLEGGLWAVTQPIDAATLDTQDTSRDSIMGAPDLFSLEGLLDAEQGNVGKKVSAEDWERVVFSGAGLTLLLPLDNQGKLGHSSRNISVPASGLTLRQLLLDIYNFYQEEIGAGNVAECAAYLSGGGTRGSLLGAFCNVESLVRVSRSERSCIYELSLSA